MNGNETIVTKEWIIKGLEVDPWKMVMCAHRGNVRKSSMLEQSLEGTMCL